MPDFATPTTPIRWRGKTYELRFRMADIAATEGELDVDILVPKAGNVFSKPEFFKRAVLLYALVRQKAKDVTIDECLDAVTGPQRDKYRESLDTALTAFEPVLNDFWGVKKEEAPDRRPLADANSGDSSNAEPSTSTESA
jgi:hypothetical protein